MAIRKESYPQRYLNPRPIVILHSFVPATRKISRWKEGRRGRAKFDLFEGMAGRVGQGLVRCLSFGASALASHWGRVSRGGRGGPTRYWAAISHKAQTRATTPTKRAESPPPLLSLSFSLCPSVLSPARLLYSPPSALVLSSLCGLLSLRSATSGRTFPRHECTTCIDASSKIFTVFDSSDSLASIL